jgi:hypothetical protein
MIAGRLALTAALLLLPAQAPTGLARSVLTRTGLSWVNRTAPGFRVYFLAGSYAAAHQDSLLARLPPALLRARQITEAPKLAAPIDLFFIEERAQMKDLVGSPVTGMAEGSSRTVILVTNREWRAFERHEIMHVVAEQAWGKPAPGTEWLQEGLAQYADGRCRNYRNADVLLELARDSGWLPHEEIFTRFRELPDLRAYLHAATFVEYLHQRYGAAVLRELWTRGAGPESRVGGDPLTLVARVWRASLSSQEIPRPAEMRHIKASGCG